jgi:hypothetical protein
LAVSGGAFVDRLAVQTEDHLNLPDDLTAGGIGLKDLPNPTPEDPPQGINPLAAVVFGAIVLQGIKRQECAEAVFDLAESGLAQPMEGFAGRTRSHGSETLGSQESYKGGMYTALIDTGNMIKVDETALLD